VGVARAVSRRVRYSRTSARSARAWGHAFPTFASRIRQGACWTSTLNEATGARDEQLGVSYPGTFVLDKQGVISEKHFEQSYRVRPTARIFADWALGTSEAAPPPAAPHASQHHFRQWLSMAQCALVPTDEGPRCLADRAVKVGVDPLRLRPPRRAHPRVITADTADLDGVS
jgi:hypothetical protein